MAIIVQKFGGTSVGSVEKIQNVANRVIAEVEEGNRVVVVVSAMGKTTDQLVSLASEINPHPSKRDMDMLLTTGEQNYDFVIINGLTNERIRCCFFNGLASWNPYRADSR